MRSLIDWGLNYRLLQKFLFPLQKDPKIKEALNGIALTLHIYLLDEEKYLQDMLNQYKLKGENNVYAISKEDIIHINMCLDELFIYKKIFEYYLANVLEANPLTAYNPHLAFLEVPLRWAEHCLDQNKPNDVIIELNSLTKEVNQKRIEFTKKLNDLSQQAKMLCILVGMAQGPLEFECYKQEFDTACDMIRLQREIIARMDSLIQRKTELLNKAEGLLNKIAGDCRSGTNSSSNLTPPNKRISATTSATIVEIIEGPTVDLPVPIGNKLGATAAAAFTTGMLAKVQEEFTKIKADKETNALAEPALSKSGVSATATGIIYMATAAFAKPTNAPDAVPPNDYKATLIARGNIALL